MSSIILCLQEQMHKDAHHGVGPKCQKAMYYHRQAMMNNINVSPNILVFCKTDIERHCRKKGVQPLAYVHCLMGAAQPRMWRSQNDNESQYAGQLEPACQRKLEKLLLIADPASDIRVDLVLHQACANIIYNCCGGNMHAPAQHMMGCLMENIGAPEMTENCEKHLRELHYFVSRNIRMNGELVFACKDSGFRLCGLKDRYQDEDRWQVPDAGPVAISCLYRNAIVTAPFKDDLTTQCQCKVLELARRRVLAHDLPPHIDTVCIPDLANFCSDKPLLPGQEVNCLQNHYAKLQTDCKAALIEYSRAVHHHPKLSNAYYSCGRMLEKFCRGVLYNPFTLADAMQCLMPFKEATEMGRTCQAEIQHYQRANINELNLNIPFKEACNEDRVVFCKGPDGKELTDIGEVVLCLSSHDREGNVSDVKPRISASCRKQLKSFVWMNDSLT
ncbi:Golgi apparatus protein 1-like [Paramacrobiotus metropolitanus]|uniref:Golgi apparatus protein 1-like n=1 Tax=Paramacrobiotus metropolitanus TaxID=2943436 RepID=UPI002445C046|nr:Golgi apparatus protein 1-like [Paramacrobiotus metropolitanus]